MADIRRIEYRAPRDGRDLQRYIDIVYQSFAGFGQVPERTNVWVNHIGAENVRLAGLRGAEISAGLGILHFGQWFGGMSVPSAGISIVGVTPAARGDGVASAMMRQLIRELHAAGVPLSVLFPSTYGLYRKAGYEPAGARHFYKVGLKGLGIRDHAARIRPMTHADRPALEALCAERGRTTSGNVDRSPREWARILEFGIDRIYAYVIAGEGRRPTVDGAIVFTQSSTPFKPYDLQVREMVARTPRAARRILTFLGDHATTADSARFEGGPVNTIVRQAREEPLDVEHVSFWMLRIVDAPKALAGRGYPARVAAELQLDIEDDLIAENCGRFVLKVAGGRGHVRRGGRGKLKTDIRGLAPLFSGHLSAGELASMGLLTGDDQSLELATSIFAGPAPWMNDRF